MVKLKKKSLKLLSYVCKKKKTQLLQPLLTANLNVLGDQGAWMLAYCMETPKSINSTVVRRSWPLLSSRLLFRQLLLVASPVSLFLLVNFTWKQNVCLFVLSYFFLLNDSKKTWLYMRYTFYIWRSIQYINTFLCLTFQLPSLEFLF